MLSRHDSDDSKRLLGVARSESNLFASDRGIGRELAPPKAFADYRHLLLGAFFDVAEIASHDRLNAHGWKKIAGRHRAMHHFRLALPEQRCGVHGRQRVRGHRIEATGLIAPVSKIGRGHLQLRQSGMSLPDLHQLAGVAKREGLNKNRIDDAEERGVGADAQRNGENRGEREGGPAAEGTHGGSHFSSLGGRRCAWLCV